MWKDSGPHYRNYAVVGSVGMHLLPKHNLDSSAINFGPASHWKGICDAKFGQNNVVLSHAVTDTEVNNVEDYIQVLQDYIQSRPPYPTPQA